ANMSHAWGYGPTNGPDKWAKDFPLADGPRQSPINIVPAEAQYDPSLKGLKLKYDQSNAKGILNNGHSFQVDFVDDTDSSTLTGGPITGTYRLKQFHFHWGGSDDRGSEHTINNVKFPCELKLWRLAQSETGDQSLSKRTACFSGVFQQIGAANPRLQRVLDALEAIKSKGKQTTFSNFDPATLLPESLKYWTYDGSLTTPPLLESVTWIVLKEPISVSPAQMAMFRALLFTGEGEDPCCMVDNYRPPQELKGRCVRASFK
uniref:carbonic anhydrase n=1 Tax=Tetraodon nigroviridis TaxID=99883 RepID=H3CKK1_TETNG